MTTRRTLNNCSCLIFTETWLDSSIPDKAIELAGPTAYRADRTADSAKKTGGGLCIYINNSWCTNITVTDKLCSPEAELLLLKCRPFYLPRESSCVYICAVYIPPDANAKLASEQQHQQQPSSTSGQCFYCRRGLQPHGFKISTSQIPSQREVCF